MDWGVTESNNISDKSGNTVLVSQSILKLFCFLIRCKRKVHLGQDPGQGNSS
jgi:hypothetical protein